MDESPIKFDQDRQLRGLIAVPKEELKRKTESIQRHASLAMRRSVITLVAFTCDDEEVQRILPPVIIGNHKLLPRRVAAMHRGRADSVYVLSRESGWNNSKLQCEILKLLGQLLSSLSPTHWFVMSLDAHGAHIAPCVFEAACRANISLLVIPASMTHILQPLDTHVFSGLKLQLWKGAQTLALESAHGHFNIETFMSMACDVIGNVMSRATPHAFASCGFSTRQQGVSERVLNALDLIQIPEVSSEPPSLQDLQLLWPQGRTIPIMSVFRTALRMTIQSAQHLGLAPDEVPPKANPSTPPLRLRLRSSSQFRVAAPASVEHIHPKSSPPVSIVAVAPCREVETSTEPMKMLPSRVPVGRPLLPRRAVSRRSLPTTDTPP